jgi:hypothetical protein
MSAFMPNKTSSVWTFGNTARVTSRCSGLANNHEQVKICLQSAAVWRMSAYSCVRLGSLGSCSMAGGAAARQYQSWDRSRAGVRSALDELREALANAR